MDGVGPVIDPSDVINLCAIELEIEFLKMAPEEDIGIVEEVATQDARLNYKFLREFPMKRDLLLNVYEKRKKSLLLIWGRRVGVYLRFRINQWRIKMHHLLLKEAFPISY